MKRRKKRITQREIGFTQGVAFAAALMCTYDLDAKNLIIESGIPAEDFRRFVDEADLQRIESILDGLETK